MAYIEKRKNKNGTVSYRALVRMKGHPPQSGTFGHKRDAEKWAKEVETDIRRGRYFQQVEARKHTLAELITRYKKEVLPHRARGKEKAEALVDYWEMELGAYLLSEVTPARIGEKRDELARGETYRKKQRSPATCNRYLGALSHVFTVAMNEWGWVDANPLRKVRRLPEPRGRVRTLTDDERKDLLKACKASENPMLYPLVVLAVSTGARRGELLGLHWRDIDWSRGVAVLHETKNRERRAVPVRGHALELLRDMAKVRRMDTDFIFAHAKHTKALFPQRTWKTALSEAKLDDFTFHDLRHVAATELAREGASLSELAAVLGHKTLAMVRRYQHLTEEHTSGVVEKMNERLFGGEQ